MSDLRDIVRARGGDPDCLHCQLSVLISLHFETRAEGPAHAVAIANALAEVCGDLVAPAPEKSRAPCLESLADLMRNKCAKTAGEIERPAGGGLPPRWLN